MFWNCSVVGSEVQLSWSSTSLRWERLRIHDHKTVSVTVIEKVRVLQKEGSMGVTGLTDSSHHFDAPLALLALMKRGNGRYYLPFNNVWTRAEKPPPCSSKASSEEQNGVTKLNHSVSSAVWITEELCSTKRDWWEGTAGLLSTEVHLLCKVDMLVGWVKATLIHQSVDKITANLWQEKCVQRQEGVKL